MTNAMTKQEHKDILIKKLRTQRERMIKDLQYHANFLAERAIHKQLDVNRDMPDCILDYSKGYDQGSAATYEATAIWLQQRINEIKEGDWKTM